MNSGVHYKNGDWLGAEDISLSVFDLAVTRGIAVFDYLRTYDKKPFMLKEHYQRLFNSMKILRIEAPIRPDELTEIIDSGIKKNYRFKDLGIRIIITAGVSPKAGSLIAGKPTLIVLFEEYEKPSNTWYENGLRLKTINSVRVLPRAKTADYKLAFIGMNQAEGSGVDDILYIDEQNNILESSTSNIFCVKNNVLLTPKNNILKGVTRQVVIDIAKGEGIDVRIQDITLSEAFNCEEVFVTATNKGIVPVGYINSQKIGQSIPGEITSALQSELKKFIKHKIQ